MSLSAAHDQVVTVNFATADGTATAGSDYHAGSETVAIGQDVDSLARLTRGEGQPAGEPNETFFVNLASATNATIADGQGVSTIVDDEPRICIGDVNKAEGQKKQPCSRRRDLFTEVEVVFFDTTSIYFEGHGGESLGKHGHSKDHRPDEQQMVVGAVLDGDGRPICCELWPGNTADVTRLIPIVDRLWQRFKIRKVCIVADLGMISKETISDLEEQNWPYILGARMRKQKEVRDEVLSDRRRFRVVHEARQKSTDPAPLKVKDVWVGDRRYVVCINEEEVEHDRAAR